MSKLIKILYISSRGDSGAGGENYLLTLFRNINLSKIKPIVVLPNNGSLRAPLETLGIEVIIIEADYGWLKPDIAWYRTVSGISSRVKKIVSIIQDKNIDIVHTNSSLRFEGALASQLTGTFHLFMLHTEYEPEMPLFQRLPFSKPSFYNLIDHLSDHIVTVSNKITDTCSIYIEKDKVSTINNGVEIDKYNIPSSHSRLELLSELGIPNDKIIITASGRLSLEKGFDYFIELANQLNLSFPNKIHFLVAGHEEDKSYAIKLKKMVSDYSLEKNFHFLGFRKDLNEILASTDIFILSSRQEGHPYVMLEAMASYCAVVAFNCAGVEDTITDGKSGFIVPIGNIQTMYEKTSLLINSPNLRQTFSDESRKIIEASFTAKKMANNLFITYNKLLQSTPKIPGSYGIELFLQNCTEIAYLGKKNIELNERLKRVEHVADLFLDNFMINLLRKLKHLILK